MRGKFEGRAPVRFVAGGLCAQLVLIAACATDDAPYWTRTGLDGGTDPAEGEPRPQRDAEVIGDAETIWEAGVEPACAEERQALHLDGDNNGPERWDDYDVVYSARLRLAEDGSSFEAAILPDGDGVRVDIASDDGGHIWHTIFRTGVPGEQLKRGLYQVDQGEGAGPGASVEVNGVAENYPAMESACGYVCGGFEIHEIELSDSTVERFVATFEQHCRCAQAGLHGCVSFSP